MTKIVSKEIEVTQPKVVSVTFLNDSHPVYDNPGVKSDRSDRVLQVKVNGGDITVTLRGADYDAFYARYGSSYSDANINEMLISRLGLQPDTSA